MQVKSLLYKTYKKYQANNKAIYNKNILLSMPNVPSSVFNLIAYIL